MSISPRYRRSPSPRRRHRERGPDRSPLRQDRRRSRSRDRRRRSRSLRRSVTPDPYFRRFHGRSRTPPRRRRYNDGRENPLPNRCLGIFGMSYTTREGDLKEIFEKFGHLEQVSVVRDRKTHQSRGFAFVYFTNTKDAQRAKAAMTDKDIDGMRVRIDYSVTKETGYCSMRNLRSRSRTRSPTPRSRSRSPRKRSYSSYSPSRSRSPNK